MGCMYKHEINEGNASRRLHQSAPDSHSAPGPRIFSLDKRVEARARGPRKLRACSVLQLTGNCLLFLPEGLSGFAVPAGCMG